ncbi:hypothetical protein VKI22_16170 [Cyanobacterium aponinum UTEX 3221]|uniref:hypothetical protein n=1 Tax=Cyanobacterium aponinum TaxID=379064 RepID=UPI002B4BB60C|nr:hypothetical protein [Cyanobacterium aponinum]WRL38138.1 hypothetical protein VKI22_16170 [Cyanobacterium aponinum UTEX 3221]
MLEVNIPTINKQKIQDEIIVKIASFSQKNKTNNRYNNYWDSINKQIDYLQELIEVGKLRAKVRENLPQNFDKFPLILLKPFMSKSLKIFRFLFKDQREVNNNVLQALEESVKINKVLLAEIQTMNSNFEEDLQVLSSINSNLKNKNKSLEKTINQLQEKQLIIK